MLYAGIRRLFSPRVCRRLFAQFLKQILKSLRRLAKEFHILVACRMDKTQQTGMQGLSLKKMLLALAPINRIADNRMADCRQMNPDLVSPPRFSRRATDV